MTPPLLWDADRGAFLDRLRRYHALMDELRRSGVADAQEWARRMQALLDEADTPELVVGVRYRVRFMGTEVEMRHAHGTSLETGETIGFDVPVPVDSRYAELEGVYHGRTAAPRPARGLLVFEIAPGQGRAMADLDVLRIEERP